MPVARRSFVVPLVAIALGPLLAGCGGPDQAEQACAQGACTVTFHGDGSATTVASDGGGSATTVASDGSGKVTATIEQVGEPDAGKQSVTFRIDGKTYEAKRRVLLDFGKGAAVVESFDGHGVVARVILSRS